VTSAALQLDGEVWLFDCGEGTQRQLQLSSVSQGSVTKVFVTHLHGDHVYGLPGLICGDSLRSAGTLHVYGPPGIREFIHSALRITITKYYPAKLARGVQVHELHALPAPRRGATIPFARAGVTLGYDLYLQEAPGTKQLSWRILSDAVTVEAAPIQHVVPCIGYVITEQMQHRVDPQKVKALGIKGPTIGQLQSGTSVVLEDGTQVQPEDVRGGIRQGRRVVILGDTCDPSNILAIGSNPDLLVHEATYSSDLMAKALQRGHSTAGMAGAFAKRLHASVLAITHFSNRYNPSANTNRTSKQAAGESNGSSSDSEEDVADAAIHFLVEEARGAIDSKDGKPPPEVIPAKDFMMLSIERHPFSDDATATKDPVVKVYETGGRHASRRNLFT